MGLLDTELKMTKKMREVMHVEIQLAQAVESKRDPTQPLSEPERYRLLRAFWNERAPQVQSVDNFKIEGPYGDIPLRLYKPNNRPALPVILYVHGGGFIVGDNDTHDGIMRRLAMKTQAAVLGVAYRLAPEWRFPVQLEEVVGTVEWLYKDGSRLGLIPSDISLAGDSAGAHLSLGAFLYMRDHNLLRKSSIRSLLLFYGHYGLQDSLSRRLHASEWDGMSEADLQSYEALYIDAPDRGSPYYDFFQNNLTWGIPPTYMTAGSLDPLVDDTRLLHAVLCDYDMDHWLQIFGGISHSFLHYGRMLPEADIALTNAASFYLRKAR